ncbi:hypothetical protein KGF56_001380 [Candida oxycetoniae]|uniref:Uncharacterized protein n=1 Tax=Candida oxycetoniae TaxID=497107 RepID=A0AAI9SYW9_9ASCO|nr:uncharacterized protein KGF56_001380 [Candida oxycetoniae]KAI3405773.1 hypothetical protein KGF56_001380 [Candida oxycetoniae]
MSSQQQSSPKRASRPSIQVSTSTITQRQLSHLNSQVAQLHANVSDFNELLKTTAQQYQSLQMLGKLQASLFMASHRVFEEESFKDDEAIRESSN